MWAKLQEAERQAAAWKEMAELNARIADEAGRERDNWKRDYEQKSVAYAAVYEELERFKLSEEPYVPGPPQVMAMVAMYAGGLRSRDPIGAAVIDEAVKQVERTSDKWACGATELATMRLRPSPVSPMSERVKRPSRARPW